MVYDDRADIRRDWFFYLENSSITAIDIFFNYNIFWSPGDPFARYGAQPVNIMSSASKMGLHSFTTTRKHMAVKKGKNCADQTFFTFSTSIFMHICAWVSMGIDMECILVIMMMPVVVTYFMKALKHFFVPHHNFSPSKIQNASKFYGITPHFMEYQKHKKGFAIEPRDFSFIITRSSWKLQCHCRHFGKGT